jgi:hypothetical protein
LRLHRNIIISIILLILLGCGNGVIVIGNSITRHDAMPSIGWYGAWGMAATSAENDFAHQTAAKLNLPLIDAINFSALEVTPSIEYVNIPKLTSSVTESSIVVIELGDNVQFNNLAIFAEQYNKLLDSVKHAKKLVCVSTWWAAPATDALLEQACLEHKGVFVFIGDICPEEMKRRVAAYEIGSVDAHPHDWGMGEIADRIVAALLITGPGAP